MPNAERRGRSEEQPEGEHLSSSAAAAAATAAAAIRRLSTDRLPAHELEWETMSGRRTGTGTGIG